MEPRRFLPTLALALGACQNYRDQLDRADAHYHASRYEAALANLDDLEPDLSHLDNAERVRFEYLRGMAHARLNQRADARHWLALAREASAAAPSALSSDMRQLLDRTLREVDWVLNPATEDHPSGAAPSGGAAVSGSVPRR
jgi:hypothetical protein